MLAFALTEPQAGSDAAALRTRAVAASDGGWVLNGQKIFCTGATLARQLMVMARSDTGSTAVRGHQHVRGGHGLPRADHHAHPQAGAAPLPVLHDLPG